VSQSSARSCASAPVALALPHAPSIEQLARVHSAIMATRRSAAASTPEPAARPASASTQCGGEKGAVAL